MYYRDGKGHGADGRGSMGRGEREQTSCSLRTFMHRARCLVYTDLSYGSLITINEVLSYRTG